MVRLDSIGRWFNQPDQPRASAAHRLHSRLHRRVNRTNNQKQSEVRAHHDDQKSAVQSDRCTLYRYKHHSIEVNRSCQCPQQDKIVKERRLEVKAHSSKCRRAHVWLDNISVQRKTILHFEKVQFLFAPVNYCNVYSSAQRRTHMYQ